MFKELYIRSFGCHFDEIPGTNFFKGVKWSPDGTCFLSNSNDNCLRLFETTSLLADKIKDHSDDSIFENVKYAHPETIYDFCWYPLMKSTDPLTCCFITTCRDNPIKLWDCFSGKIRASYIPLDRCEELQSAIALTFDIAGTKIYSSSNASIRAFDVSQPGSNCLCMAQTNKGDYSPNGLHGLISCLDTNPDNSGLLAAGSYSRRIGLFTYDLAPVCYLEGHSGGITSVKFSKDGRFLFSAARKDNSIKCWDIRNTQKILFSVDRIVSSNQHIGFDFCGDQLWSGSNDGFLYIYDISDGSFLSKSKVHEDSLNDVSICPSDKQLFVTCSGHRRFDVNFGIDDDASNNDNDNNSNQCINDNESLCISQKNSLVIWRKNYMSLYN